MAVPIVSHGSDDATTDKTELIYDPSEFKLSTPVAETFPGVYWYLTFNYVPGPNFEVSLNAERFDATKLYAVHNRWYIDIRQTVSRDKELIVNSSMERPNYGPVNTNVSMWCWSACV